MPKFMNRVKIMITMSS